MPFYNEKRSLRTLVLETLKYVETVIAVDDGSTDSSANEIKGVERVILLSIPQNLGKGNALNIGFRKSIELGFDCTITLDADLQHDPKCIPALLEKLRGHDLVIGNRLQDLKGMPVQRRASNFLTSRLLSLKTGLKILDSQSGYRAYRTGILPGILPDSSGFEAESEILVRAALRGLKFSYSSIPTIYGQEDSKMKALSAIRGFLKVLLKSYKLHL